MSKLRFRPQCKQHQCIRSGLTAAALMVLALLVWTIPLGAGEIHQAIRAGDAARVAALLKADPGLAIAPDEDDPYKSLPLHFAAIVGNVEIARMLLDAGAGIDCGDTDESTPLDCAAMNRRGEMVAFLISSGADVNRRDRNGACPMSFAATSGDSAIVGQILRAGADLNHRDNNGTTLLHIACGANLRGLFDMLAARGCDLNVAAVDGTTPLHVAAGRGRLEMIDALLAAGASHSPADEHGQTPLFSAVMRNRAEAAERLITAGADPNATDQVGNTALHPATWTGNNEVLQVLIRHGAEVDVPSQTGRTAIFSAIDRCHTPVIETLIAAGTDVNFREPAFGATPLQAAALRGYREIAEMLLAAGADPAAANNAGTSALEIAVTYGHRDVAELLLARGATGSLAGLDAGTLAAQGRLSQGEAVVWYLNHSGYAVKTRNHLLVFDCFNPTPPPTTPGLCNGRINPKELARENVMAFVTHEHQDHFDPAIFNWRTDLPKIKYVLGCRPDSTPKYEFMGPREVRTIDGVKITTINSNDTGVGYWIEVDGLVIFHAGDHANRWRDFSGPYKEEIEYLAATGKQPDIAFMPISGCGFGDQEAVKMGVYYALETLKPRVFMPMHSGGGGEYRYRDFVEAARDKFPSVQMIAPLASGDHFRYRDGRVALADL